MSQSLQRLFIQGSDATLLKIKRDPLKNRKAPEVAIGNDIYVNRVLQL